MRPLCGASIWQQTPGGLFACYPTALSAQRVSVYSRFYASTRLQLGLGHSSFGSISSDPSQRVLLISHGLALPAAFHLRYWAALRARLFCVGETYLTQI